MMSATDDRIMDVVDDIMKGVGQICCNGSLREKAISSMSSVNSATVDTCDIRQYYGYRR